MSDPWLTIVGLTEDGLHGLTEASLLALREAEVIFGAPRHLALVGAGARGRAWPVPFAIDPVLAQAGRPAVILASGDPFWHGAGARLAAVLPPGAWRALPAPSVFSLIAARLGWALQDTICLGLHAAPFETLRRHLHPGARLIVTLRDETAAEALGAWLAGAGFGASQVHLAERIGGPQARLSTARAEALHGPTARLVAAAIEVEGAAGLPRGFGLPEALFATDGQITKAPVRALTLAALGPRPGARLWDLGAGSGSVSVEWCLNGGVAEAVETRAERAANIAENARRFGLGGALSLHVGESLERLPALPDPQAVFIGGGASEALIAAALGRLGTGGRLVVNAVTLETEALLAAAHARHGGTLMRAEIAEAEPLGRLRGWAAARPIVQWRIER